jgi:hypothetical protein
MGKFDDLYESIMSESPLALDIESRPLVRDWEPSKFRLKWEREVMSEGNLVLVQGSGMFGIKGYGLFMVIGNSVELLGAVTGGMYKLSDGKKPFKILEVAVAKKYRMKGYAVKLYDMLIKLHGSIASDNALFSKTKGSIDGIVGIWLKRLPKKYTVKVYSEVEDDYVGDVGKSLDDDEETFLVAYK